MDDYATHTLVKKSYPTRSSYVMGNYMPSYVLQLILILITILISGIEAGKLPPRVYVQLGPLYNCSMTKSIGLYGYGNVDFCGGDKDMGTVRTKAEVMQYFPEVKSFKIYLCV